MADESITWVLVLVGALVVTWLIVDQVAGVRDNAVPAIENMAEDIWVDTDETMLQDAYAELQAAAGAQPPDPEALAVALKRADWTLESVKRHWDQYGPEHQAKLDPLIRRLRAACERVRPRVGTAARPDR